LILPATLVASAAVFIVLHAIPGDVAIVVLSGSGESTHSSVVREAFREEMNLNDPLLVQYLRWAELMVRGEFGGRSLVDGRAISLLVSRQLPVTGLLFVYALAVSTIIWVPLGLVSAYHRGTPLDTGLRLIVLPGRTIPSFVMALFIILCFLSIFKWSPPIVYTGVFKDWSNHVQIMMWPVMLLVWECGSHILPVTRASVLDWLDTPFVLVARAKGLSEKAILLNHALSNAWHPIIAVVGVQATTMFSSVIILEAMFGIPGVGRGLVESAMARDYPVVQTLVTILVFTVLVWNVVVDVISVLASPRSPGSPVTMLQGIET